MKLLKEPKINANKYPGVAKFDFVYNDFHSRNTNPGYSRNCLGGFYTK
jgi:hypothetical protein